MAEEKRETVFSMMESSVPKFSGDDHGYSSAKWAQDIEENAEIFGWTAQQKLIVARRALTGTAELWLRTEKVHKNFEELKTALQKEFPDAVNVKEMHELMAARKKKRDETYYQYMLIMKEMGKRAKFPDYVSMQYIIDGIQDSEVNKTILYGCTTFAAMKDKLAIYEKIKSKSRANELDRPIKHQAASSSSVQKRCYNCGEEGHTANRCTNGIKCFRCNQFGHIGRHCKGTAGEPSTDWREEQLSRMSRNHSLPASQRDP